MTKLAIRESRAQDLRKEILNSSKWVNQLICPFWDFVFLNFFVQGKDYPPLDKKWQQRMIRARIKVQNRLPQRVMCRAHRPMVDPTHICLPLKKRQNHDLHCFSSFPSWLRLFISMCNSNPSSNDPISGDNYMYF